MSDWKAVDEVLEYAIEREQASHDYYMELASKVRRPEVKEMLEGFAREELGHRKRLEAVRQGGEFAKVKDKPVDLKISDYLVDIEPTPDLDYAGAIRLAMQREKQAFRLYSDLARQVDDPEVRATFERLAEEEARHKLRFEIEFDEHVLTEN